MRLPVVSLVLSLVVLPSLHAQVRQAQPSGRGTAQVTLVDPRENPTDRMDPVSITVDYGQPHLRGRSLHTAGLVPYDQVWRTGANQATTFTTGVDLTLGGAAVAKGHYFLFTLPTQTGWKLILQKDAGQEALPYKAAPDDVRVDLRHRELPMAFESLTVWLIPATGVPAPRGELRIMWGRTELSTDWVVR